MKDVRLVSIYPTKGEIWHLAYSEKSLQLLDENDEVVMKIPHAKAGMRIKFPSFWASVNGITFESKSGDMYRFEPKPKALAGVRAMVDEALQQDPGATSSAYRGKAVRDLLIGTGSLAVGITVTALSYNNPAS